MLMCCVAQLLKIPIKTIPVKQIQFTVTFFELARVMFGGTDSEVFCTRDNFVTMILTFSINFRVLIIVAMSPILIGTA